MAYELRPTEKDNGQFFRLDGEFAERYGAIGYMRADFGRSGREFWTTWFDCQRHLKTQAFKYEFDDVIDSLRNDGLKPPFASRENLIAYLRGTPGLELPGGSMAFMVQTTDFSYYMRCRPQYSDYDIGVYAYDNRYLLPELAGKHELPLECLTLLPSTGEIIYIMKGNEGYYPPFAGSTPDRAVNRQMVDEQNKIWGVTRAQEEAMKSGSMFGWDTPAAKPWNYDDNGNPRPLPQKNKNAPENGLQRTHQAVVRADDRECGGACRDDGLRNTQML